MLGWLSEFSDEDWFPKKRDHDPSSLSLYEDENHLYVEAALPGLNLEDVEVSYEKGVLWIKGEKKEEEEDKKKKFYRKASSAFSYHIRVPSDSDESKEIEASFKNGMMKVIFKKRNESAPKKIAVKKN